MAHFWYPSGARHVKIISSTKLYNKLTIIEVNPFHMVLEIQRGQGPLKIPLAPKGL
jgi:hypothetical protein